MSDEPALLRAIVESPDDLALRFVYADWCEEHGRAARAALVRGQCFLDPLLPPDHPDREYDGIPDARYLSPQQISQELRESVLEAFRPMAERSGLGWDDGLTTAESHWYAVRRGFVERLHLVGVSQLMDFLPHAAAIFDRTPLLTLAINRNWGPGSPDTDHLPAELARQLVALDGIERLRELNLSSYNVGEAAAQALLGGKGLRLTKLNVRERSLSARTRDALRQRFGDALLLGRALHEDDIPF